MAEVRHLSTRTQDIDHRETECPSTFPNCFELIRKKYLPYLPRRIGPNDYLALDAKGKPTHWVGGEPIEWE